ncbi:uncharacterized protein TrAtP1_002401 [Trichoderma atroviride]|uniref:uncharacterized protein n=1 Tax=Hypocrea atroviridis TaxID=63577 RepID=UPI0033269302|nr:hypothetical protein TrAtP1_002401 [Trichoderma atroviride]
MKYKELIRARTIASQARHIVPRFQENDPFSMSVWIDFAQGNILWIAFSAEA